MFTDPIRREAFIPLIQIINDKCKDETEWFQKWNRHPHIGFAVIARSRGMRKSKDLQRFIDSMEGGKLSEFISDYQPGPSIQTEVELEEEPLEELVPLIEEVLHSRSKMVIASDSKAGKTWLLMDLCAAMARGEKWLGIKTRKSRVLYIDFELQKQLTRDRFRLIKKQRGYDRPAEYMEILNLRGYPMSAEEFKDFLLSEVRSKKFDAIFVDPIYKLMVGMDHNAAGDVSKVLGALEEISRRISASIIYADHYAKGNSALKKAIDRIAGSGVTARDPDTMIMFTEVEDALGAKDGRMAVEFTLRGFKPKAPFAIAKMEKSPLSEVRADLDPTRLAGIPGPKPRASADELLALLPDESGLSTDDWMKAAEEKLGIKKTAFYDRQKDLKNRSLVHKSGLSGNWEKTAKGMGIEQKKPEDCDGPDQDPF